jgi:Cys-rich repeat protein
MKRRATVPLCVIFLIGVTMCALPLSLAWGAGPDTAGSAPSALTDEIAVVGATQNDAKVQRAGEAEFKRVARDAPLYLMDFVSTGRNSKLWWKGSSGGAAWSPFPSVTHGSLGEHTVFGFARFQSTGPAVNFTGQLNTGIVRLLKTLPPTEPPSSFVTITPTARIDVLPTDRAADYVVQTDKESRTTVTVLWGRVKVRNIAEEFKEERVLTSCQEVDVEKDKEPGEIRWVSSDTMGNLIKRTTIPKTLPTDVPSCERLKTEVIQRPGRVFIPPPGLAVVPIPVPVPPGRPEKCPCPEGSYMNPETKQCSCCPRGKLYNAETCACECPCPPGHQYDPQSQRCAPCREGAVYNRETCRCACPCPEGQILMPGTGCVQQCPEGYVPSFDTSAAVPRRCPVCVEQPVPRSQIPPPCGDGTSCGRCETCVEGKCVRKSCPEGLVLNRLTCECRPLISRDPQDCHGDGDCPACQECRDGKCKATVTCSERERLNLQTCNCEPVTIRPLTGTVLTPIGCRSNQDCGSGEVCRNGKCVRRPPRTPQADDSAEPETMDLPPDFGRTDRTRTFNPGIHINIGGSGSRPGGGPSVPKRGHNK